MKRKFKIVLAIIALFLASLTCTAPANDLLPELELPTPGPTPTAAEYVATPTAPPVFDPPDSAPQTFTGDGIKNDYSSEGAVCLVNQPVTLVLKGDGTAELTTTGADIIDHANCTAGASEETWYMNGLVDVATQTVTFQTCNFGNFTAGGSLSLVQGMLAGQVSCTNKDGIKFITLVVGQ